MTDLRCLTNDHLVERLKKCIQIDRENGAAMIAFIEEVDRRRLYLNYGHTSLFSFLTKGLGLSNASAQLRIDSARLMKVVPEIRADLSSGSINLSQLAVVAQGLRQKAKESPEFAIEPEVKKQLIEKIKNKDATTTQKLISQELDLDLKVRESKRVQKDESVRLEITLAKEQMLLLERAKELLSHVNPNPSFADLITMLAERFVKQKDPMLDRKSNRTSAPEALLRPPKRYFGPRSVTSAPEASLRPPKRYFGPRSNGASQTQWASPHSGGRSETGASDHGGKR